MDPLGKPEGAGKAGGAVHPQPVCNGSKHTVVTTGTPEPSAFPARWLYGLCRALPGDEFVLPPSSANMDCLSPVGPTHLRRLDTSNGCQDHTVLPSATAPVVLRDPDRSQAKTRPAINSARPALPRPPHPIPTSVTIAIRPSCGTGWRIIALIWDSAKQKYFCQGG